jgi:cellulase (glycosyl hydrolase family 5)
MPTKIPLIPLLVLVTTSCQSVAAPNYLPSAAPTATSTEKPVNCADLDANWGKDWRSTVHILDQLMATNQRCGDEPLVTKSYAAHYNYAVALEQSKQLDVAIQHYRAALLIDSQRREALDALARLKALPAPTPPACPTYAMTNQTPAPREEAKPSSLVAVKNDQLMLDGKPFKVKGVNYYPRNAPWQRFLRQGDLSEMATEIGMIKQAGFNTVRIFLWYESLFVCSPEDAIPNESTFAKLDALFMLARQQDLKIIVTLNDLPDLYYRPLYTDWAHYDAQTIFLVRRYRNEPNILAWDLRNEGDLDYGARASDEARFKQADVLGWLGHTSALVRLNDPAHLLTAGWWGDPIGAAPFVDFLSFHHWADPGQLKSRIIDYRQKSTLPLLLEEVGYHGWAQAPQDARDETTQATLLAGVVDIAMKQGLAGWVVWTAFDFVSPAGQQPNYEYYFGMWHADLTPKPVLKSLPLR